jgi:hypothetical protein
MPLNRGGLQRNPEAALKRRGDGHMVNLDDVAVLAGWASPQSRDHKDTGQTDGDKNARTQQGALNEARRANGNNDLGTTAFLFPALTTNRGVLNPALSRWLMGFRPAWDACAPTVMPSSRKLRRSL